MIMEKKVFILVQESNVDGEILVNATPCHDEATAKQLMAQEIKTLKKESHFAHCDENDIFIEETSDTYFIKDETDDYHEYLKIEEKEIV